MDQLINLRRAATKQALNKYMDDATDDRLVSAIARAKAGGHLPPDLHDAIRQAIKNTEGLELFNVDATILPNAEVENIQKKAIIKHNELILSRVMERVLDDKKLFEKFIAAPTHQARRDILNAPGNK